MLKLPRKEYILSHNMFHVAQTEALSHRRSLGMEVTQISTNLLAKI